MIEKSGLKLWARAITVNSACTVSIDVTLEKIC